MAELGKLMDLRDFEPWDEQTEAVPVAKLGNTKWPEKVRSDIVDRIGNTFLPYNYRQRMKERLAIN